MVSGHNLSSDSEARDTVVILECYNSAFSKVVLEMEVILRVILEPGVILELSSSG